MIGLGARIAAKALRQLPPETAHALALKSLEASPLRAPVDDPRLAVEAMGLRFANPFGLAAGFDKRAEAIEGAFRAGFGFHEVGGVTPRPQPGNPRPRVFRLSEDRAVINRLGFNNPGVDAVRAMLAKAHRRSGPVGVNVGANKDSPNMAADFAAVIAALAPVADYFAVNVSSPNTPGLRDLQAGDALRALLSGALDARDKADAPSRPVLVKIAPDLDAAGFEAALGIVQSGLADGLVLTNTTLARDGLASDHASEAGGLSGAPLFERSTRMLAEARLALGPHALLIGVGGVTSPERAVAKIEAGATLVQLYTGLIYEGLGLLSGMKRAALDAVAQAGAGSVADLVGGKAKAYAG